MSPLRASTAFSEDIDDAFAAGRELATNAREKLPLGKSTVAILFASIRFDLGALVKGIRSLLDVPLVGCTTHSEGTEEGYFEDSAVLMLLTSDEVAFGIGLGEDLAKDVDAAVTKACDAAAKGLDAPPKLAIVLPDAALSYSGEAALASAKARLGPAVPIVGGLPGDGGRLQQTFQVFGDRVVSNAVVVLLLAGDVDPVVVTRSGWIPIGQRAIATKTAGATVLEIDGRPAIEYLKRYVSNVTDPATLAMYPLAIVDTALGLEKGNYFVIRAPFSHDPEKGSVTYGGSIPEGTSVQLVKGTRDDVVAGVRDAAETLAARLEGRAPACLLFFSCAGRKLMLGLDTKREIATMLAGFPNALPLAGFYSYGELGPLDSTSDLLRDARFHNTTIVLCALTASNKKVAAPEVSKNERVLQRKIDQLQRKLEQIDHVARENEKVSSNLYRELDALSRQLTAEKANVSALLRVLEKYVPQGARNELERYRGGPVVLGGARVRRAILFSDLRGFTTMSERLSADTVVGLLNEYLQAMTGVILAHEGDVNEYIGDAILAVFRDSRVAVSAAMAMQAALEKLRREAENPELRALRMGIGIHFGDVVEGNIGTPERMKFGVVGDTVNTAARIQDRSRDGKATCVLVSDDVRAEVEPAYELELVGDLALKGKAGTMRVYEIARARA